jgi:hypothetical protein
MTHKQISDIVTRAQMFFSICGKHPDIKELVEGYRQNQEEIGEESNDFCPSTVFEAFCLMYHVEPTEEHKIIFKTVRILFDSLIK